MLMTTDFSYSTTYILDKSHFSETYDASAPSDNAKKVYLLAGLLSLAGLSILQLTEIEPFIAWFIIALAGLEIFSLRFRKPWWLARQLISKAANTELTLHINEEGVSSKSLHVESTILWADINKIEQTSQGWMLFHSKGKNYVAGRCLSEQANEFIQAKSRTES